MMKSGKVARATGDTEDMQSKPKVRLEARSKWEVIGSVATGAIHLRKEQPCQDALHTLVTENYAIACVADGHGSSACPHSDDGSKAAVKIAAELLATMLEQMDAATISAQKEIWLPKQIESKWKEAVKAIHAEAGRDDTLDPFPYILYGTTLLALAATESFVFALQIGDGDILMVDRDGVARPLLPTEEKVGEDTESLCLADAWKYVRTQIVHLEPERNRATPKESVSPEAELLKNPSDGAPMFLLSTDGYANSFADSSGFLKAGADFLRLWQEEGSSYINENLAEWLRISSDKGSGDDISLALVCW